MRCRFLARRRSVWWLMLSPISRVEPGQSTARRSSTVTACHSNRRSCRGRLIPPLASLSVCLRFACLAYRRNTAAARSVLCLPNGEGVEIQFRSAGGGHAVCYLYQGDAGGLLAVLTFKGSTLSSPGAPGLGVRIKGRLG